MADKKVRQRTSLNEWLGNMETAEQVSERITRTVGKLADILSTPFTQGEEIMQKSITPSMSGITQSGFHFEVPIVSIT